MAGAMTLQVLTDTGLAIDEQAVSVIAPGEVGYLGILRNHAPLVTTLIPGTLTWQRPDGTRHQRRMTEGLLEISKNQLTILTRSVSDVPPASHTT